MKDVAGDVTAERRNLGLKGYAEPVTAYVAQ
jgi:hypothetical protein